jgi:hypothetical protein
MGFLLLILIIALVVILDVILRVVLNELLWLSWDWSWEVGDVFTFEQGF